MQRTMPSRSSRSHIAYLVCSLPCRGFLVCENLTAANMPPTSTSVRASSFASCELVCEQYVRSICFVLGQRMAGEIEAEHFLFHRQPLPLVELGQRRAAPTAAARRVVGRIVEQAALAAAAIGQHGRAGLHGPVDARPCNCARLAPSESNAPALTSASIVARLQACGSTRSQKSNRLRNGPPCFRAATIASAAAAAAALDRARPKRILPSATVKSDSERFTSGGTTSMPIRRQSSRCSTSESFFLKLRPGMSPDSSAAMNSTG